MKAEEAKILQENCKIKAAYMRASVIDDLKRVIGETEQALKAVEKGKNTALDCFGRNVSSILFTITENYKTMRDMDYQAEVMDMMLNGKDE